MGADAAAKIYQYGPPPTMYALISMAKKQREDELWRMYMAEISWLPAALMVQDKKPDRFPDLLDKLRGKKSFRDERTAQEIIDSILNRLRTDVEGRGK